jgi:hypothetical protein
MSAGTPVALNTFWRRRMAMLPKLVRLNSSMSGQNRGILALFGLSLLLVPTWCQQAQSQFGGGGVGGQSRQVTEDKSKENPDSATSKALDVRQVVSGVNRPKLPLAAAPAIEYFPELSDADKRLAEILDEEAMSDVVDGTLDETLEKLRSKHPELQFVLDRKALNEAEITSDTPDLTLKVSGISLRSWLKLVLDTKELTFFFEDEVIKVTTKDSAQGKLLTRTYPVRDLVSNVDADYLLLKDAIEKSVPTVEDGGTISILPAAGCLIISNTRQGHEDTLKVLRSIRKANKE